MRYDHYFSLFSRPENNTLVSGNVDDEKNLHPGGCKKKKKKKKLSIWLNFLNKVYN